MKSEEGLKEASVTWSGSSPQSGHESFFLSIETMELLLLVPQWNYSMGQTLR